MKRILLPFLTICAIVFAVSCTNDYGVDIEAMEQQIAQTNDNLTALEQITANLGDFRDLLTIAQSGDPIVSATPVQDGYTFTFKNNGPVTVHNQTAGLSAGYEDGTFFWTLNGQPLLDAGKKVPISTTPVFRVNGKELEVSVDGKNTWTAVALSNDPVIAKVDEDAAYITATLLGNTVVAMPKEAQMSVALSGDGSTMASTGRAVVDFLISGKSDEYTVTTLLPEGWASNVVWENSFKGLIEFIAPAAGAAGTPRVFFCDGLGRMVTTDIDFSALTVDESFPVMYPAWDAYCIGCEGGQLDVALYTNLEEYTVTLADGCDWLAISRTKAVREETVSFVAEANESSDMRSVVATIASGNYEQKVVIWQEGVLPASVENLSANGTANCYIVTEEGDYYFDANVMGCGQAGIIANVDFHSESAELFPESVAVWMNQNDVISNVRLENKKIYFHASGAKGNAAISVKNSLNRSIWSWHIWCTDAPKELTHTNPDYLQFTVLDRNLGATSADPDGGEATYGVYYQWGRKDPYEAPMMLGNMYNNSSHAFAFAIRYPERPFTDDGTGNWYSSINNYLWGNPEYGKNLGLKNLTKTIYDPCPVGYMVPPANTFMVFKDESRTQFTEAGLLVRTDYGQTNFFPFAGKLYMGDRGVGREIDLWHSCSARYGINEDGGGCLTRIEKEPRAEYWYLGDKRVYGASIRCVKQVTE